MNCPGCQAPIPDQSVECPICFRRLAAPPQPIPRLGPTTMYAPPPMMQTAAPLYRPPARRKAPVAAVVTVALVALVILGVGGGFGRWLRARRERMANIVYPLAGRERILEPGDSWTYRMTGSISVMDMELGRVEGRLTKAVERGELDGKPALLQVTRGSASGGPGAPSFDEEHFFQQDSSTGDTVIVARRRGGQVERALESTPVPGEWSAYRQFATRRMYAGGQAESQADRVAGWEVLATPAGRFSVWRVESAFEGMDEGISMTGTGTIWYAPQLGSSVREELTLSGPMGIAIRVRLTLLSTSVRLEIPRQPAPPDPNLILHPESGRVR